MTICPSLRLMTNELLAKEQIADGDNGAGGAAIAGPETTKQPPATSAAAAHMTVGVDPNI